MSTYKVPSDVQREDTIVGPLTMRQLIICGAGGALSYVIYVTLAKNYYIEVWLLPVAFSVILTVTFAFVKIHNLSFFRYLLYLIEYIVLPKKRTFIKGSGDVFTFEPMAVQTQKKEVKEIKDTKPKKSMDELVHILDHQGMIKKPQQI
ncbi:MAG: PrgI family protein [Candidatus Gracilibacteria bacterium]